MGEIVKFLRASNFAVLECLKNEKADMDESYGRFAGTGDQRLRTVIPT